VERRLEYSLFDLEMERSMGKNGEVGTYINGERG
jgi:hypothetical protein